jgi:hypothetical protein
VNKNIWRSAVVLVSALCTVLAGGWLSPVAAAYSRTAAASWVPNSTVHAVARSGDRIYIAGAFTSLRNPTTGATVSRARVAALDANTGQLITSWNPGANGTVHSVAVGPTGTVYLGGTFTTAAGGEASRLAAVRHDGTALPGWTASANNTVFDVHAGPSGVYAAGTFGRINNVARARVARLDAATGAVVTAFDARVAGGRVRAIAPSEDGQTLVLGGLFTSLGGASRNFVGSVSMTTGAATSFAPARLCDNCNILDITTGDGRAYAAVAGPGGRAVGWSLATSSLAWSRGGDGDVQAIDYDAGLVYAGGHFGPLFSGAERHQLAVLDARRGTLQSYTIPFSGRDHPGINAVLADSDALRIGGGFTLQGNPAARFASFPTIGQ